MKPIFAVIGCGYWGPNLIRNFVSHPRATLRWACDLDARRLETVLAPYPAVQGTSDIQEILDDPSVLGVAIATPVSTHFPLARLCLEHGKHVLLEKPLASSVAEGEQLFQLARSRNLQIMCDHTFCYTGAVRKIKAIIDSGELGDILYYDSVRINLGLFQHDVNVIWDLAIHDLAIIDFLFNITPMAVSAQGVSHAGPTENIGYVTLTYPNAFIAHIHVNWLSPVKIRKTIIGGNRKMIEWNDLVPAEKIRIYDKGIEMEKQSREDQDKFRVSYRTGDIHAPCLDGTEALVRVVDEFIDSIKENRPPLTDVHSGLRVLKILDATDRSLREGGTGVVLDRSESHA